VTVGCDFEVKDRANIPAAIQKIEQAMTPATMDQCEAWLVMLQAATAHRSDSDVSSAVAYALYASELRQWPADVAKSACEKLARGKPGSTATNWFPTLAEVVAECEKMAAPRKVMLAALHNWAPVEAPYPSARGRPEPSEAEREAVRKMAASALHELAETAKVRTARGLEMPSIAGKTDERGITPQMRELMARRAAGQ